MSTDVQRVTKEGRHIVVREVNRARDAMAIGMDTRTAYSDGALAALERIAELLGVDVDDPS